MAWYWIVLIALGTFILGFTAALFWLRDVVRRNRRPEPPLPHFTPTNFVQMNPYASNTTTTF